MTIARFPNLRFKALLLFAMGWIPGIMVAQLNELQRLTASANGRYTVSTAESVAFELVRPLTRDPAAIRTLGHWLARKEMDWQEGPRVPLIQPDYWQP